MLKVASQNTNKVLLRNPVKVADETGQNGPAAKGSIR
jgi:hypothetical protein